MAVIDHVALQGGQHVLVGSSIGAWIALKAAASRREAIRVRRFSERLPSRRILHILNLCEAVPCPCHALSHGTAP